MCKIRVGKIDYINKGDLTNTKVRKKFLNFLERYRQDVYNISTTLNVLNLFIQDKKVAQLGIFFPAFIDSYIINAWLSTVTLIYGLFSYDTYSVNNFIKFIKANYEEIFTAEFYEITHWNDGTITEQPYHFQQTGYEVAIECENLILNNKELIQKVKTFRNKRFAHFGDYTELNDKTLEISELNKLLELFSTIYNKIREI